uniref:ABC transporter domain-containing protein n=1 Tax=Vannella robusta TaxID=1487602 RepID=A0A7S4IA93_9EUKA
MGKKKRVKPGNKKKQEPSKDVKVECAITSPFACTGALRKQATWNDIIIDSFSLSFYGKELIADSTFQVSAGRRYGLVGANGCGKSSLLKCLGSGEAPIPDHIDVYYVAAEVPSEEISALDCVLKVDTERLRMETQAAKLSEDLCKAQDNEANEINTKLCDIYERLDALDAGTAEARASKILFGLGFDKETQKKATKEFSGGWRMRIALARALFIRPTFLILDEPTNHLDMESCVWLEEYLSRWNPKGILLLVSHSQDFLNGVCTNIIHFSQNRLNYYSGNYDAYVRTRMEKEEHQMKNHKWEQDQIKHMKQYIARFGHGSAKLARQAKSKEKTLARMQRGGLTSAVFQEKRVEFFFPNPEDLSPPVLVFQNVSFGYSPDRLLYKNLEFGIDLDSRVALVGPNGVGKTTLLKLILRELEPTDGTVIPHNKLRFARFNQHFVDQVDLTLNPLEFMRKEYPEVPPEEMRSWLGRFGISGGPQLQQMATLSDGQKSRVIFSYMAKQNPHILLLDEPTNHLDIETIDALADAINAFTGGVVLVSHDMRLISVVAEELWLCENQSVTVYRGDISSYKSELREGIFERNLIDMDQTIGSAQET